MQWLFPFDLLTDSVDLSVDKSQWLSAKPLLERLDFGCLFFKQVLLHFRERWALLSGKNGFPSLADLPVEYATDVGKAEPWVSGTKRFAWPRSCGGV